MVVAWALLVPDAADVQAAEALPTNTSAVTSA